MKRHQDQSRIAMRLSATFAAATAVAMAVAVAAAVAGEPQPLLPPAIGLEPRRVIECAGFVGDPIAVRYDAGRIYLLDPMEQAIWSLTEDKVDRQAIDLPSAAVTDFFFGCEGKLHAVDPLERALYELARGQSDWRRFDLGYRVFFGDGDRGGIVFNADRRHADHLVAGVTCAGDTTRWGTRLTHPHPYAAVGNNLNYARLAVSPDLVVVGHIALAYVQVFRRDGPRVAEISLVGPEVAEVRRMYLATLGVTGDGPLAVARDTLVADLVRGAKPEQFPVPVYVAAIAIRTGRIYVLVNNVVQAFSPAGELLARYAVGGEHRGQRVVIHTFCFADDGRLLGLDAVHYRKLYDFGLLAP